MWSSWTETAKASLQQALEKTGDVLDKTGDVLTNSVTQASRTARESKKKQKEDETTQSITAAAGRYGGKRGSVKEDSSLFHTFQTGWSTMVESTKASLHRAQEVMEEQQHTLQKKLAEQARPKPRALSLPLDVAALQDASVVYLTDRILTLSHPAMASSADGEITGERKLAAVGHLLHKRHDGRFMVWNLSEVDYDATLLDDQVLNYSFPGSPSPPLGLFLKLLVSMESWLKADSRNVAVVHCLTGKGRTSTVVASFLCWMREAGFVDIEETLTYIAQCKQVTVQELTIPSQRRYTSYFKNMLDGIRPSQPPLLLKRVILSHAPKFAQGPGKPEWDEAQKWGCVPYIQLFKSGKLVFTAPASKHYAEEDEKTEHKKEQSETKTDDKADGGKGEISDSATKKKPSAAVQELPFCHVGDGSVSFNLNQIVQGDVLVRCRHLTAKRARVSMFRAAFHTGYIGGNVLRLTKAQLDGACTDHDRFNDDFYMDIVFESIDAEEAGKLLQQQQDNAAAEAAAAKDEAAVRQLMTREAQALAGGATTVTASAYDTMLDRDSRFWDVIAKRKQEQESSSKKKEGEAGEGGDAAAEGSTKPARDDPFWGPTVGRRRPLEKEQSKREADQQRKQQEGSAGTKPATPKADTTFSIGGEMDFLPKEPEIVVSKKKSPIKKVRDSLMEALTGALNDDDDHNHDDEEVVFVHEKKDEAKTGASVVSHSKDEERGTITPAPKTETQTSPGTATTVTSVAAPAEKAAQATITKKESTDSGDISASDVDQLLSNVENLDLDDDDMNALLASGDGDENNDEDDADLQDLEDLLGSKKK